MLKITKDTEKRCIVQASENQMIYLNWKQIIKILDLMIYQKNNSIIYLDEDEGD